jgi:pimeloyl-ACP methyl ester carboxylesterase
VTPADQSGELPGGLSYFTVGDGEPLVVLPGLAREPKHDASSFRALAHVTNRRIHVVNRPRGLRRGLTMTALAAAHARALDAHFGSPVDVFGVSTGGAIALQLAVDAPAVTRRLIVAAAASCLGDAGRRKLRKYGEDVANGHSGAGVLASVLAPRALRWIAAAGIWVTARRQRAIDPGDMLATIDAECGFDVTSHLGAIAVPTLIIGGARDHAFSPELFRATAAGIPGAQLVLYPRAGHLGTMLHPRFGSDVAAFLARPL